jgi:hypothetical protein
MDGEHPDGILFILPQKVLPTNVLQNSRSACVAPAAGILAFCCWWMLHLLFGTYNNRKQDVCAAFF